MSAYGDDAENVGTNPSTQPHMSALVDAHLSRRRVLLGGMATAVGFMSSAVLTAPSAAAAGRPATGRGPGPACSGTPPSRSATATTSGVPPGYSARPFLPWGTPLLGALPAFRPGANTAAEQEQQVGMHHDGMHFFPTRPAAAARPARRSTTSTPTSGCCTPAARPAPARRARRSPPTRCARARRRTASPSSRSPATPPAAGRSCPAARTGAITANTPMRFAGPAAGHRLLRTAADPAGHDAGRHVQQLRATARRRGART